MQAKNAKVKLPFNIDNKGYNKTQVDEYLDLISGEFSNLNTGYQYLGSKYTKLRLENEQLEAEIRRLKANSASADASHIGQALIDARKIAAQITNQAKQEADLIIRNANEQANIAEAKKSESIRLIEQMQQQIQDIILGIGGAEANNKNTDNKPLIVTEEIALPGETVLPEEIVVPEKFAIPADPVPASPQMNGTKPKRKRSALRVASSILFYVAIIGAVFLAFVASGKTGDAPRNILGYSYFTVLSGSMQKEIPVGSLVITRKIDPDKLQIGDNITFMKSSNTSVTHKIIGIYENYNEKETRGFQTQGVNNPQPDKDIVDAANVIGKVVFTVPGMGKALSNLNEKIIFAMIFLGLLLLLSFTLQVFFGIKKQEQPKRDLSKA